MQLELLLSSLLFLSREGIRLALLRTVVQEEKHLQQVVNLSSLPALLVLLFSGVVHLFCPSFVGGMSRQVMLLYCGGAFFESLGEPLYNLYNQSFRIDCRLKADAAATLTRSLLTFVGLVVLGLDTEGFGLAQLGFGAVHFGMMLRNMSQIQFSSEEMKNRRVYLKDLIPRVPTSSGETRGASESRALFAFLKHSFGSEAFSNAFYMTATSLLKHLLTEADKIVLSLYASHYDQAVYGVVNNYGSLVARLVFQPIEETSRISFAKMAASSKIEYESNNHDAANSILSSLSRLISTLLNSMLLLSICFPLFGPFYARVAVKYGLGGRWYSDETVQSLGIYCVYVLTMGLNGITEAFVNATAPAGVFSTVNSSMVCSSALYCLLSTIPFRGCGACGILVANIGSMCVRIVFNVVYIQRYFSHPFGAKDKDVSSSKRFSPFQESLLTPVDMFGIVLVSSVLFHSSSRYVSSGMTARDAAEHILLGSICFLALAFTFYKTHGDKVRGLLDIISSRHKSKTA